MFFKSFQQKQIERKGREYDYDIRRERENNAVLKRENERLRGLLARVAWHDAQTGDDAVKMRNIALEYMATRGA